MCHVVSERPSLGPVHPRPRHERTPQPRPPPAYGREGTGASREHSARHSDPSRRPQSSSKPLFKLNSLFWSPSRGRFTRSKPPAEHRCSLFPTWSGELEHPGAVPPGDQQQANPTQDRTQSPGYQPRSCVGVCFQGLDSNFGFQIPKRWQRLSHVSASRARPSNTE